MADTKITALAAIATVDPAADVLPIVDISDTSMAASGTTKKVTSNQILGAGGTATLASATITGAATVGTTLGVTGVSTLTGAVGVGATPIGKFDVYNTGSDTTVFIRSDTTRLGQIVFRDNADAGNQGLVRYDHANDRLSFTANGAENLFLLSTGDLSVQTGNVVMGTSGKGIDFSATASGSGTMTSELLNDYEEGTWTPTLTFATPGTLAVTYSTRTGNYTKVGNLVTARYAITINPAGFVKGTASGGLQITGIPFAASGTGTQYVDLAANITDQTSGSLVISYPSASIIYFEQTQVSGIRVIRSAAAVDASNFAATNTGFIALNVVMTYTV